MEDKIPAMYLMSDSFLAFPDPHSAVALVQALNKILGKDIETKDLKVKGEEVRKKFNTLMEQTKALLQKTKEPEMQSDKDIAPLYR